MGCVFNKQDRCIYFVKIIGAYRFKLLCGIMHLTEGLTELAEKIIEHTTETMTVG